jgi:hypothetical protein
VSTLILNDRDNTESVIGTPFWMSPEVISKNKVKFKILICSIILKLIFGLWESLP